MDLLNATRISTFQSKLIFSEKELTMACCGRGSGKSAAVAARIVYRNINYGRSSLLIAPTFGMIKDTLMPSLEEWFGKMHVKPKINWSDHTFETAYGRIVLLSGTRPDSPRGYTNLEDFYADEAAYLSKAVITNGIMACRSNKGLSSTQCFTSTGRVGSYFNKTFKKPPIDDNIRITASTYDNPFTTAQYKRIVFDSLKETPELLKQELLGGLDAEELNLVFPPSSFSQIRRITGNKRKRAGIDFAYEGNDTTTITIADDNGIVDEASLAKDDGTLAFEQFKKFHQQYNLEMASLDDTGGFASGFLTLARSSGYDKIVPFNRVNFGAGSPNPKYANMRAFLYFNLRQMIHDGFYVGREDYEDELVPQTYFVNTSGKIQITPKKLLKLQLGKSPDKADSLALACYHPIIRQQQVADAPSARRYR